MTNCRTIYKQLFFVILCTAIFCLASCQALTKPRIVLWHSWEGNQAVVINDAVERFQKIFDDVIVVTSYVPSGEMIERYIDTSAQGLGPDIFLGSSTVLRELAQSQEIAPIAANTFNTENYYTSSVSLLMYNDQLYGVPFAMQPFAMYYNRDLVSSPASNLSELIAQAELGTGVAINTRFSQVLWGVQAFGGKLLGDNGQITLNQGAFTNWLNWLVTANANPNIFLSRDTTTLRELFTEERVAYYTGSASELTQIRSMMNSDAIGVAPLPAGPNGASGPLMQIDALMFNPSSSSISHEKAKELAVFLTNLEQSTIFMRDLEMIPANRQVRVDLRTYPAISGFIAQTRTAIATPYLPQVVRLLELGDDLLLRVIEGVLDPNTVATNLTTTINTEFGLTTLDAPLACTLSGQLLIWHSLTNEGADYLTDLGTSLGRSCPNFELSFQYIPQNEILEAYIEAIRNNEAPDMLTLSSLHLQELVEVDAVLPVERDRMQRFSPISQATVSLAGTAYGMPLSLISNVFYYNPDLISDPPLTTDELLIEASPSFSLARHADNLLWSLTAYNGILVSNDALIPDAERIKNWVEWLAQVDEAEHIDITANNFLRKNRFSEGESAYYVDSNLELKALTESLGDALAVAPFPIGTNTFASPLVTSLAMYINPNSDNIDTALQYADMITDVQEQERMVQQLRWIPVNITADQTISDDPLLSTISEVMQNGIVINDNPSAILTEVSRSIDLVFRTEQPIDDIAQNLFQTLSEIGGGA